MQIIAESDIGYLLFDGNELTIGSKIDDPPKLRGTSKIYPHGGGGFAISANASLHDGVCDGHAQGEMAMLRWEQAEDVRGQVGNLKGEANFMLNDGGGGEDANMQKPLAFVWNAITRTLLGLFGGGGRPDTMWAPQGLTFTQQQDDGNFVTYKVERPFDKGANPVAVWSAWTGFLG